MERGALILKRAVECASSRMLMDVSGKDHIEIFKSITFNQTR